MTQRPDDSVQLALAELRKLEDDRLAAQARARVEERELLERRQAERRSAEDHAQRVAEAEARERVQVDLRARDAEAERRMASLRAELEAVRADRERVHAAIAGLWEAPATPRGGEGRGWLWAFGATAAVAAGLLAILVVREPVVEERIVQVPTADATTDRAEPEPAPEPGSAEGEAERVPESEAAGGEAEPASADPEPAAAATPTRPRPHATTTRDEATAGMHGTASADPALDFEGCGNDPTCGIDLP